MKIDRDMIRCRFAAPLSFWRHLMEIPHFRTVFVTTGIICLGVLALNPDLGLNLLAEYLGVLFTVVVIDAMLRKAERNRIRPLLRVAGKDIQKIYNYSAQLLSFAVWEAATSADAALLRSSGERYEGGDLQPVLNRLSLDSSAGVVNASSIGRSAIEYLTWRQWLPVQAKIIIDELDHCLERYSTVLPPEIFEALHALRTDVTWNSIDLARHMPGTNSTCGILLSLGPKLDVLRDAVSEDDEIVSHCALGKPRHSFPFCDHSHAPTAA